jgi:hypothetical protein
MEVLRMHSDPRRRLMAGMAVVALLIGACGSGPGQGGELVDTHWNLQSYVSGGSQVPVPEGASSEPARTTPTAPS